VTEPPEISVLVPTYRYARYLPEAIDSVLRQEGANFEVVVADDASGDGSAEVMARYSGDPRFRGHVHEKNKGMVENWNWCLRQARGRFVKFVFGDDRLESPRALARLAEMLREEPRAVLAASARLIIDEDSRGVEIWDELGSAGFHAGRDVIAACAVRDRNLVGEPTAVMFRREAAARGFDPQWRQVVDQEMWFHLLQWGGLVYDPEPLCAFRVHVSQQTAVNRDSRIGVSESLILLARYLDSIAEAIGKPVDSRPIRRLLFHCLYYSHKDSHREGTRSPAVIAAENALMARLTPRKYSQYLVLHRLTKPLANLRRKLLPTRDLGHRPLAGATCPSLSRTE